MVALCGCSKTTAPPANEVARVVFKDASGRELTTKDLASVTGKVQWEIVGGEAVPSNARKLHDQGRAAASRGDHEGAIVSFEEASRIAPSWPYPVYDAAFTYELMGDRAKAEAHYERVERLAPRGFFTAKTSLDCLRRERAQKLPEGFCKAFAMLEWMDDEDEKRKALESIVAKAPGYSPAWKALGPLLHDDEAYLRAITKGLDGNPDAETSGVLLINRALILARRGERENAIKVLGELALDPGSTLGTEMMAKAALASIVKTP